MSGNIRVFLYYWFQYFVDSFVSALLDGQAELPFCFTTLILFELLNKSATWAVIQRCGARLTVYQWSLIPMWSHVFTSAKKKDCFKWDTNAITHIHICKKTKKTKEWSWWCAKLLYNSVLLYISSDRKLICQVSKSSFAIYYKLLHANTTSDKNKYS